MNNNNKTILITGGAGFIGSELVRHLIENTEYSVVNIDKLTYSGNLQSLVSVENNENYIFMQIDICDENELKRVFTENKPDIVMHLAAESHVDRSIDGPKEFIQTNIVGTFVLLEQVKNYWQKLHGLKKEAFRFLHVSTDEVYGDLNGKEDFFLEDTAYDPSSPYSATKASSDHLVRAWFRTYQLPVLITNCSNNYGPYQFPEKLIPHIILNAIEGKDLPIYGDGKQIRDWLYVNDHARALTKILFDGKPGRRYNIGGNCEKRNIDVVKAICNILDELKPLEALPNRETLIRFVEDRPGHDYRYAIDCRRLQEELGWSPRETFVTGLRKTVEWYVSICGQDWVQAVSTGSCGSERRGLGR